MKSMLIVLALVMLSGDALAEGAAWQRKRVMVRDYTSTEWQGVVSQTVAVFNRVMPKSVPRLRWRSMPAAPCESLPRTGRGITFCVLTDPQGTIGAETHYWQRGHEMSKRVRVKLSSRLDALPGTICHELMHALTGIPDPNAATPQGLDSCVMSQQEAPGAYDVSFARRVYRKHGR